MKWWWHRVILRHDSKQMWSSPGYFQVITTRVCECGEKL